jgi:epoxyqueuosine reductase
MSGRKQKSAAMNPVPAEAAKNIKNVVVPSKTFFDGRKLTSKGLNIQAILQISELSNAIIDNLKSFIFDIEKYQQLILIGHSGRNLWAQVSQQIKDSSDPIDDFSCQAVKQTLSKYLAIDDYKIIYPGDHPINLQALGKVSGWHFDSPMKIGINDTYGSWFAYRVAVVADSQFEPLKSAQRKSPCTSCIGQDCIKACPANALNNGQFLIDKCSQYRLQSDSRCQYHCIAREACPAGQRHQYSNSQIEYHYGRSLECIKSLKPW